MLAGSIPAYSNFVPPREFLLSTPTPVAPGRLKGWGPAFYARDPYGSRG